MGTVQEVFDMYSSGVGIWIAMPSLSKHIIIRPCLNLVLIIYKVISMYSEEIQKKKMEVFLTVVILEVPKFVRS